MEAAVTATTTTTTTTTMTTTTTPPAETAEMAKDNRRPLSVEELCFTSAMSCFEGWLKLDPAIGPRTMAYVTKFISRTLEKTHNLKDVRETLSRSVEVWIWITRDFAAAIPSLTTRSIGPLASLNDPDKGVTPQESTALITKNYPSLKEDLQLLIKLMHIARNLLVVPEPEIPQDLCAAAQFDQMLYQTIILCINVTSKAYDGDVLEEAARLKLSEITELYKKLLVTCLQQAHNWIAKNDRNKMAFWSTVLFDDDALAEEQEAGMLGDFRPDVAKAEVQHWFERNSRFCDKARQLLRDYEENVASKGLPPGHLPCISPLAWNWMPAGTVRVRADDLSDDAKITPEWKEDEPDKFEQDKAYGRVSREIDTWWLRTRDPNYEEWLIPMPPVEFAQQRTETCKANLVSRYAHSYRPAEHDGSLQSADTAPPAHGPADYEGKDGGHYAHDYAEDLVEEEDIDDDDSYGEGPMNGLLTEVPNILDPKQIEALHMIVKSCILDNAGLALSRAGENLQKTRCRMFLALECGRSLLREILVFIAVWEKSEQSLIFQLTTQIVEAIHHSALVPFAWQSLRIPKDIISPAQTVLLRLVNSMFRARNSDPPPADSKEHLRDVKLLHYFFIQFRSRIVPECASLMHLQAQIRENLCDPADFPVDSWDMERAKDGIQQFLELLTTASELPETRKYLIEWEAVYDLLTLLKGLEAGVPKKPMVEMPNRPAQRQQPRPAHDDPDNGYDSEDHPLAPPPPLEEPAHKYPWAGIKGQILHIIAALLQPPPGRSSPGNPTVQSQVLRHNGVFSLLSCCSYDDHNRYARERVQLCLKWLMDGSDEANDYLRKLIATSPQPPNLHHPPAPSQDGQQPTTPPTTSLRIDGIAGEVKVRLRAPGEAVPAVPAGGTAMTATPGRVLSPPLASMSASATMLAAVASAAAAGSRNARAGRTDSRGDDDEILPPLPSMSANAAALAAAASAAVAVDGAAGNGVSSSTANDRTDSKRNDSGTLPPVQHDMAATDTNTTTNSGTSNGAGPGSSAPRSRPEELLRDIITLADEAARLAMGRRLDADETEDEGAEDGESVEDDDEDEDEDQGDDSDDADNEEGGEERGRNLEEDFM